MAKAMENINSAFIIFPPKNAVMVPMLTSNVKNAKLSLATKLQMGSDCVYGQPEKPCYDTAFEAVFTIGRIDLQREIGIFTFCYSIIIQWRPVSYVHALIAVNIDLD